MLIRHLHFGFSLKAHQPQEIQHDSQWRRLCAVEVNLQALQETLDSSIKDPGKQTPGEQAPDLSGTSDSGGCIMGRRKSHFSRIDVVPKTPEMRERPLLTENAFMRRSTF